MALYLAGMSARDQLAAALAVQLVERGHEVRWCAPPGSLESETAAALGFALSWPLRSLASGDRLLLRPQAPDIELGWAPGQVALWISTRADIDAALAQLSRCKHVSPVIGTRSLESVWLDRAGSYATCWVTRGVGIDMARVRAQARWASNPRYDLRRSLGHTHDCKLVAISLAGLSDFQHAEALAGLRALFVDADVQGVLITPRTQPLSEPLRLAHIDPAQAELALSQVDVLWAPSAPEPLTQLAMAAGATVVLSLPRDDSGFPRTRGSGFVLTSLASAGETVKELLRTPEQCQQLNAEAVAFVEAHHSLERVAHRVEEVLDCKRRPVRTSNVELTDRVFDVLTCPRCGQRLRHTEHVDLLGCPCALYPLISGIVVIHSHAREHLVSLLRAHRYAELDAAVSNAFGVPSQWLSQPIANIEDAVAALLTARPGAVEWLIQLRHFYGTTKYQTMLRLGAAFKGSKARHILDVGAGGGHFAHVALGHVEAESLCLLDCDLAHLRLARALFGDDPRVQYVLADASTPLPFCDAAFDLVLSADALHYIPNKPRVVGELNRVLDAGGSMILTHLHNRDGDDPAPGEALTRHEWLDLFRDRVEHCQLLADSALRRELRETASHVEADDLQCGSFTLLSGPALAAHVSGPAFAPWRLRSPVVNPLYQQDPERPNALVRNYPSRYYQQEFDSVWPPERLSVPLVCSGDPRRELVRRSIIVDATSPYASHSTSRIEIPG